ncbi:uncharacterized [Tachysurus ichikawai]
MKAKTSGGALTNVRRPGAALTSLKRSGLLPPPPFSCIQDEANALSRSPSIYSGADTQQHAGRRPCQD